MPKHQECFKNNFFPEMPILRNVHVYIFLNGIWSFHYTVQLFHSSKMHLGFPERNANILSKNTRTAEFYRNKKFRPNPGEKACLVPTTRLYLRHFSCMHMWMSNYNISNLCAS